MDIQFTQTLSGTHLFYTTGCKSTQTSIKFCIANNSIFGLFHSSPIALYTFNQSHGKGQQDKIWEGLAGQNLAISIAFPLLDNLEYPLVVINKAIAVAVRNALQLFSSDLLFIKWPNDIVTDTHKICGLLMEVVSIANKKYFLLGIGVNVNQKSWDNQPKAVSLCSLNNAPIDMHSMLEPLLTGLVKAWSKTTIEFPLKDRITAELSADFDRVLWHREKGITLQMDTLFQKKNSINPSLVHEKNCFGGILLGVNDAGCIFIQLPSGDFGIFHHGEVRIVF
ncbi:MAG: hypothetical protein CK532_02010 [Flavobacteriales bacterium]|nr:MAG: hypothetical protein CK532_02010 [Flavobacteriales bacterium]